MKVDDDTILALALDAGYTPTEDFGDVELLSFAAALLSLPDDETGCDAEPAAPGGAQNKRIAELEASLTRLLSSDQGGAICAATDEELVDAMNDPEAGDVVREQAAAVLQARAVLRSPPH